MSNLQMKDVIKELKDLYSFNSKHSNYQILSSRLNDILEENSLLIKSRHEKERLAYILSKLEVKDKTILDIGGNSGYFTFELIDKGAKSVHYYEGNSIHAQFVKLASKVLLVEDKIKIDNKYFTFDSKNKIMYDIAICMNVLHHIGDDYGNKELSIENAKQMISKQLCSLAKSARYVIFQMGFNWKGDVKSPLFMNGTKMEMINFLKSSIYNHFIIKDIGIAENDPNSNNIKYKDLNNVNNQRNDELGEFLNRPLFILESIKLNN